MCYDGMEEEFYIEEMSRMIEIRPLSPVSYEAILAFGFNGFKTDQIMTLSEEITQSTISFALNQVTLEQTYIKEWPLSPRAHDAINETIKEGLSFGAYESDELLAFVLATRIDWNKSLWIENIRVSDQCKGQGIAKQLIRHLESFAREEQFRVIGLEVMASNIPAINLYKQLGFTIDGFDKSHYPTRKGGEKEIAIFMKSYISDLV